MSAKATKNRNDKASFVFVPFNGQHTPKQHHDVQKAIRKQVMHHYRGQQQRRPNQKAQQQPLLELIPTKSSRAGAELTFRLRARGKLPVSKARHSGCCRWEETMLSTSSPILAPTAERNSGESYRLSRQPLIDLELSKTVQNQDNHTEFQQSLKDRGVGSSEASFLPQPRQHTQVKNLFLSPGPQTPPGVSRIDSFGVLPFHLSRREEILLNFFRHYKGPTWCPVTSLGPWFNFALHDELLFRATMFHWSCKISKSRESNCGNEESLSHKLAAIRLINQRLHNPFEATRIETLGAVTALISAEISMGNLEEARQHMAGLNGLINLGGGLPRLSASLGEIVVRLIQWNQLTFDQKTARSNETSASIDPNHTGKGLPKRAGFYDRVETPKASKSLSKPVISFFCRVQQLFATCSQVSAIALEPQVRYDRAREMCALEGELDGLLDAMVASKCTKSILGAPLAIGLSYLLHVSYELAAFSSKAGSLYENGCLRLWQPASRWKEYPEVLIWSLTAAAIMPFTKDEHRWFMDNLMKACRQCGISDWTHYRAFLAGFFWFQYVDEGLYLRVWNELQG